MGSPTKIQQLNQILCDAENDVWEAVSKLLHTHSQVTGFKIDCCKINSSFTMYPGTGIDSVLAQEEKKKQSKKPKTHVWVPVEGFPALKINGFHPVSKKLIKNSLITDKFGDQLTVLKCNKLNCEVENLYGVKKKIPYETIVSISDSVKQYLNATQVKKVTIAAQNAVKKSEVSIAF